MGHSCHAQSTSKIGKCRGWHVSINSERRGNRIYIWFLTKSVCGRVHWNDSGVLLLCLIWMSSDYHDLFLIEFHHWQDLTTMWSPNKHLSNMLFLWLQTWINICRWEDAGDALAKSIETIMCTSTSEQVDLFFCVLWGYHTMTINY
jgi:hypothetical protein